MKDLERQALTESLTRRAAGGSIGLVLGALTAIAIDDPARGATAVDILPAVGMVGGILASFLSENLKKQSHHNNR